MPTGLWGALVVAAAAMAQQPLSDSELSQHLTVVSTQIADPTIDPVRREELALDMAATLDRGAQSVADPEVRRRRWAQAIDLLDRFSRDNPDLPLSRQLRFQAAVFRWAQAQTWRQAMLFQPGDSKLSERAIALLDDAITRLRSVSSIGDRTTLGENLRFRLAQALADRADLAPADSPERKAGEAEAMELLKKPATELGLAGYWHLLRADLARKTGDASTAVKELDEAARSKPAPPEPDLFDVRIPLQIAQKQFAEAMKAVDGSHLDAPMKGLWKVRLDLAELPTMPQGGDRSRIAEDLFREIQALRSGKSPESRLALMELARSGIEPEGPQSPETWDAMAEAYQVAGDSARAGVAATRAADRAAALGQAGAATGYRLRAGAYYFQGGKFNEADATLTPVADDPAAGPLRARAGLLRALARGRAVAMHLPGASTASYQSALERQIRDFPHEPTTDEARWLLGELAIAAKDRDRAVALWSAIIARSPRWLDARLAIAAIDRDELDWLLMNPDRPRISKRFMKADGLLAEGIRQARGEEILASLLLARARLNLTPNAGRPEVARDLCERVARLATTGGIRYRARLLRVVALTEIGRYVEAEREAQTHSEWDDPGEHAFLLDVIRLLDQCASTASTDLRQRRFGLVLRLIVEPLMVIDQKFTPEELSELKMRLTRALLFVGEDRDARRSLSAWRLALGDTGDRLLRDLGDTYSRLEVYTLDIDVQRLRLQNNAAGSPAWFDARYALALAYYHSGQFKESAQLIDATSILHPDLGGGELQEKFIRLRQRLGAKP
ncbi:MAG: tetratricopeptide repeat protein [Isosphaeraceae bacterium]